MVDEPLIYVLELGIEDRKLYDISFLYLLQLN